MATMTNQLALGSLLFVTLAALGCQKSGEATKDTSKVETKLNEANKKSFGAPIASGAAQVEAVSMSELAKNGKSYVGKNIITQGKVEKVCQHMGCWMTLKDESGEAYIRMAGHAFTIPKDASGKTARVSAKLVEAEDAAPSCGAHGGEKKQGCKEEAEKANGKPLAKLELEATGVELY
jgi:Rieske Fe-S protein